MRVILGPRLLEQEPAGTGRERLEDVFVMVVGGEHEYFGELPLLVVAAVALIARRPGVHRDDIGGSWAAAVTAAAPLTASPVISMSGWVPQEVTRGSPETERRPPGEPKCVQQLLYDRSMSVGFRPTEEDLRVIEANRREDEKTSDVIRRALRLLDREAWEERARADMHRLRDEDLSAEADAWEYDADGNIRITGTSLTVPARPADLV